MTFRNTQSGNTLKPELMTADEFSTNTEKQIIVNMGIDDLLPFKLKTGFSCEETTHRWTVGTEAVLSLSISIQNQIRQIIFETFGLVSENKTQMLLVSGRGIKDKTYLYSASDNHHSITIDFPAHLSGDIDIHFKMPNACKACEVDTSNSDQRLLAISFTSARVFISAANPDLITGSNHLPDLYINNHSTITEHINALIDYSDSCQIQIPSDFNPLETIKEIAKHECWKNQGGRALFFKKTPDGVTEISTNKQNKLADLIKLIADRIKLGNGKYMHGARSTMTTEFYDLILQLEKERMNDGIRFWAMRGFCQKWKLNITSLQLREEKSAVLNSI